MTRHRSQPTQVLDSGVPVGDTILDVRTPVDETGLWRPGLAMLARTAGTTEAEARQRVLQTPERSRQDPRERQRRFRAKLIEQTWRNAGVPHVFRDVTYDALTEVRRTDPAALEAARAWSEGTSERPGLLLRGRPGNGKSSVAAAALRDVVERTQGMRPVRFRSLSEILVDLQAQFRACGPDGCETLWEMLSPYRAVVLDELGKRKLTDWAREQLHMLFDLCWREGKRLVVTTNIEDAAELDAMLHEATVSRIYGMCDEVWFDGPDYRLERPENRGADSAPPDTAPTH